MRELGAFPRARGMAFRACCRKLRRDVIGIGRLVEVILVTTRTVRRQRTDTAFVTLVTV